MPRINKDLRATREQLKFYIAFCKEHPELLDTNSNHYTNPKSPLWDKLSVDLNRLPGPTRSGAKWRKNLLHWKSGLLFDARKATEFKETGCGQTYRFDVSM